TATSDTRPCPFGRATAATTRRRFIPVSDTRTCPLRSIALLVRNVDLAAEQLEGVREHRAQHLVAVAAAAGGTGQVDDQGRTEEAGDPARQQGIGRLVQAFDPQRLRDAGRLALEHVLRRLRRDVARRKARTAGCEDDLAAARELAECRRDVRAL